MDSAGYPFSSFSSLSPDPSTYRNSKHLVALLFLLYLNTYWSIRHDWNSLKAMQYDLSMRPILSRVRLQMFYSIRLLLAGNCSSVCSYLSPLRITRWLGTVNIFTTSFRSFGREGSHILPSFGTGFIRQSDGSIVVRYENRKRCFSCAVFCLFQSGGPFPDATARKGHCIARATRQQ